MAEKVIHKDQGGGNGEIPRKFTVSGRITYVNGTPLRGITVRAFDRDLRNEELLGEYPATDADGRYEISYTSAKYSRAEKSSADLIVRAIGPNDVVLGESTAIFNAGVNETVDLVVTDPRSEYERLAEAIAPLLAGQGIGLTDLVEDQTHQDFTFLAGETGESQVNIRLFVLSEKLSLGAEALRRKSAEGKTGAKETRNQRYLRPEIFYGLLRQNPQRSMAALLALGQEVQRRSLDTAIKERIISKMSGSEIDRILEKIKSLMVQQAFEPPPEKGKYSFGELLATALPDKSRQDAFLATYFGHKGPIEQFWKGLRTNPKFKGKVDSLQFTLLLGAVTGNHLPLVKHIQTMKVDGKKVIRLRDLAGLEKKQWQKIIADQDVGVPPDIRGKTVKERRERYAQVLEQQFEKAFPGDFIAQRVVAEARADEEHLRTFFRRNVVARAAAERFDLGKGYVEHYLKAHPDALSGIPEEEQPRVTQQLATMQRLFKLTPQYADLRALLDGGLTSSRAITYMSKQQFAMKHGPALGGASKAKQIFERAEQVNAMSLALYFEHATNANQPSIAVLPGDPTLTADEMANWEGLFGSLDLCACEHCRSVYSPAAYFVDVLHFLSGRTLIDQITRDDSGAIVNVTYRNTSAKHALFERRPDLGQIELTCENTNTEIPYVDLVTEVLENAIAPYGAFNPFSIDANLESDLNERNVSAALREAFHPTLSDYATVTVRKAGAWWTIAEPAFTYTVRKENSNLRVTARTLQTSGTQEERAANPQYQNAGAYEKLRTAVYPWDAPFDLWVEEAKIYLEHLGLKRHSMLETFAPGARAEVLRLVSVAAEHLGLTSFEQDLITGGRQVRLATTGALSLLAPPNTIDGTVLGAGNLVLVKDQGDPTQNGIYLVRGTNVLQRVAVETASPLVVTVTSGTTNRNTKWLLAPAEGGGTTVGLLPEWMVWGFDNEDVSMSGADGTVVIAKWYDVIRRVDMFLKRTGLDDGVRADKGYKDLLEILQTRFVNPPSISGNPTFEIGPVDPAEPETCELNRLQVIVHGTNRIAPLQRLHRFLRLAKALDWRYDDLDRSITALQPRPRQNGPLDITPEFLVQLSHIERLCAALKLPIVEILAWWAPLDTTAYRDYQSPGQPELPSLYEAVFLDKAVINPPDAAFALNSSRTELRHPWSASDPIAIRDHKATMIGALGIREEELALLIDEGGIPDQLNLANLSALYRYASLAKALKLRIRDFLNLLHLTDARPFDRARTEEAVLLVEKLAKIRAAGFSIEELDYLLRHVVRPGAPAAPADNSVDVILNEIRLGLGNIADENRFVVGETTDPDGALVRGRLAVLLAPGIVDKVMAILDGTSTNVQENNSLIDAHFQPFLAPGDAKSQLVGPPAGIPLDQRERRFLYVLEHLMAYLSRSLSESFVKQTIAERLRLELSTASRLLTEWVNTPENPSRLPLAAFLDPNFVNENGDQSPWRNTYVRLYKIALVLTRLKVMPQQAVWLFDHAVAAGWYELAALPVSAPAGGAGPFAEWEKWEAFTDFLQLRSSLPLNDHGINELLGQLFGATPSKNECLTLLGKWTEWPTADLATLVGDFNNNADTGLLGVAFPDEYRNGRILGRLSNCFALLRRAGVSAATLGQWVHGSMTEEKARGIKQAAKAKYEAAQWLTVAKPLQDMLRERRRAALVSFLLTHPDSAKGQRWNDVNDLYAYFLIDVEMTPCQTTSRIKQAIGSAQLFVQRCLMNLEVDVDVNTELDTAWGWWKWMKNYRVWEANRKVFLYPENWIEPELRDDKSPFFKELENELLQNELTQETAETAFLHYLEKLDQVARLDIVGMYHERESDNGTATGRTLVDVLHVFGRTYAKPHVYFYRKRVNSSYWTAWERVDLDIEGDHLIPVVWNRRLYLFWPIFTEEAVEQSTTLSFTQEGNTMQSTPIGPSPKKWKIQLAWSEYKNGKWLAKKLSDSVTHEQTNVNYKKEDYYFSTRFTDTNKLEILVWDVDLTMGKFVASDCHGDFQYNSIGSEMFRSELPNTIERHQELVEIDEGGKDHPLILPRPGEPVESYFFGHGSPVTLNLTPGQFRLRFQSDTRAYGRNANLLAMVASLFFQDGANTFFVAPKNVVPVQGVDGPGDAFDSGELIATRSTGTGNGMPQPTAAGDSDSSPAISEPSYPVSEVGADNGGPEPRFSVLESLATKHYYLFQMFFHPYVCSFVRELNRDGIDGLLQREVQRKHSEFFKHDYDPQAVVAIPGTEEFYPKNEVDFSFEGAYSLYNWELFFHAPLLIADRLNKNQRFEDAQKWFHYIFDPTDRSGERAPARHWQTRPFFERSADDYKKQRIQDLLKFLATGVSTAARGSLSAAELKRLEELEESVARWREDPFKPHQVARLRTVAYQKTVVMKYIENLIAWGDQLFRRDTIEAINEATQLYVLAADILGKRPAEIPTRTEPEVQTYDALEGALDPLSDALVPIENLVPAPEITTSSPIDPPPLPQAAMLSFCIPKNDKLLGCWDTVADRLFKIRHCMNIEGVVRRLPLFEPPIDPALLVKAAAAGIDINSALNDINAALPHYRFNVMSQKASELCTEVKALGATLLSALEKRDAEALALLRSTQELRMLMAVRQVKEKQIEEAKETHAGLLRGKELVQQRVAYYRKLLMPDTPLKLNASEAAHIEAIKDGIILQGIQAELDYLGNSLSITPEVKVGAWSWGVEFGGRELGNAMKAMSSYMGSMVSMLNAGGSMSATLGGHQRRLEEWLHQESLAKKELDQIDKQIAAAEIRLAIAEKELANHDLQVENAEEVDEFMREKYTNQDLYNWMVGQVSGIYFQSYQLAYDVAKRAERAYRYELALENSDFIRFGYWESLKKGLLSGERLYHDIKRMEMAYHDNNRRELELTKHVSLRQLNPVALLALKATGSCEVTIPEWLYDLDCPGHYMRRIKSVAISIPSVTGPYTSVNCTLSLLKSSLRKSPIPKHDKYTRQQGSEDDRFVDYIGAVQSIVTSSASNDSGLFETNLRDKRFLPFEGAGAESTWKLDLPKPDAYPTFDYATISDVVLHIRYTARQGVDATKVREALDDLLNKANQAGLALLFSLRHDFPTEWSAFVNDKNNADFKATIHRDYFPYFVQSKLEQGKKINISGLELYEGLTMNHRVADTPAATETTPFELSKEAPQFSMTAKEDTGANAVVERKPGAQVFLVVRYTLET